MVVDGGWSRLEVVVGAGDVNEGVVDDGGCERVGFGVNNPKLLWDSVPLNSGNSFLPDDSRNDSGGI